MQTYLHNLQNGLKNFTSLYNPNFDYTKNWHNNDCDPVYNLQDTFLPISTIDNFFIASQNLANNTEYQPILENILKLQYAYNNIDFLFHFPNFALKHINDLSTETIQKINIINQQNITIPSLNKIFYGFFSLDYNNFLLMVKIFLNSANDFYYHNCEQELTINIFKRFYNFLPYHNNIINIILNLTQLVFTDPGRDIENEHQKLFNNILSAISI